MGTGTHTSQKQRETNRSVARALHAQTIPGDRQAASPPTTGLDEERRHRMEA